TTIKRILTPREESKPLVSVCMITYNHELYVKQAIEGVLNQIVDFEVELVISDDKSTDSTAEKINEVINTHPNGKWIRFHSHPENKGIIRNFMWTLLACRGDYMAICEGDDYWTDNFKLKKQLEDLEENKEVSGSFHLAKIKYEGKPFLDGIFKKNVP